MTLRWICQNVSGSSVDSHSRNGMRMCTSSVAVCRSGCDDDQPDDDRVTVQHQERFRVDEGPGLSGLHDGHDHGAATDDASAVVRELAGVAALNLLDLNRDVTLIVLHEAPARPADATDRSQTRAQGAERGASALVLRSVAREVVQRPPFWPICGSSRSEFAGTRPGGA